MTIIQQNFGVNQKEQMLTRLSKLLSEFAWPKRFS